MLLLHDGRSQNLGVASVPEVQNIQRILHPSSIPGALTQHLPEARSKACLTPGALSQGSTARRP